MHQSITEAPTVSEGQERRTIRRYCTLLSKVSNNKAISEKNNSLCLTISRSCITWFIHNDRPAQRPEAFAAPTNRFISSWTSSEKSHNPKCKKIRKSSPSWTEFMKRKNFPSSLCLKPFRLETFRWAILKKSWIKDSTKSRSRWPILYRERWRCNILWGVRR